VGGPAAPRLQALDRLLRSLTSAFVDPSRYPPLLAVELTADTATLHLAADVTPPEPWTGGGTRWSVQIDADVPDPDALAPYPMLVSVGADDAGTIWLLNLERFGVLGVVGTPADAQRFGRHVAAELALSPWSTLVQVHTLGFGEELADLDEFRLSPYPAGDTSAAWTPSPDQRATRTPAHHRDRGATRPAGRRPASSRPTGRTDIAAPRAGHGIHRGRRHNRGRRRRPGPTRPEVDDRRRARGRPDAG